MVADALSRVEAIESIDPIDSLIHKLASLQEEDDELKDYINSPQALKLTKVTLPNSVKLYCDTSTRKPRPFVPAKMRKEIFYSLHNLSHPGIRATINLIKERFIWPFIEKNIKDWTRECESGQRAKITKYNRPSIGTFTEPDARFLHIHLDLVGPLPPSKGKTHVLTIIDRFSRWAEAIPLADTSASNIASLIVDNWVARFGCPEKITTDNGSNLTKGVFPLLYQLLGVDHRKTTPYHPASNAMIERFHRSMKDSLRAQSSNEWTESLPWFLLGYRASIKSDIGYSPAELLFGTQLRIPGEFFTSCDLPPVTDGFITRLASFFHSLQPPRASRHGQHPTLIHRNLNDCTHVFIRNFTATGLQPNYTGPYLVKERFQNYFTVQRNGAIQKVNIEHLKPAFEMNDTCDPQKQKAIVTYSKSSNSK